MTTCPTSRLVPHHSTQVDETPCIGYVAVEGYSNLAVRIMAMEGRLDLVAIREASDSIPLWGSFHDMLHAYEAAAD